MIKKFTLTREHYELGYNGRPINDTWLIETKEGILKMLLLVIQEKKAGQKSTGQLVQVEKLKMRLKKAQDQVQMVKESIIWMAISQKIC